MGAKSRQTQTKTNGSHKVDFVIAGAQKSGTRALRQFLSQHVEIGLATAPTIECHFFDNESHFSNAPVYERYHQLFSIEALEKITGDVTPNYLYWKEAIPRIHAYNPSMKFIVLLRNPIDRTYSHWVMQMQKRQETSQFTIALLKELFICMIHGQHRNFSYLQRSFYSWQIKRLRAYFSDEQCFFVRTEDLFYRDEDTIRKIGEFLGLNGNNRFVREVVNKRDYEPMSPLLRLILKWTFHRETKRVEKLLGWDCTEWRA